MFGKYSWKKLQKERLRVLHIDFSFAEFVNQILIKMLKIEEIEEKYWLSVIKNVIINIIIKIRD